MTTVAANGADINNGDAPSQGVITASRDYGTPALDLTPLRLLALRSLLSLLDQIAEPKTLLLDATLAGPLGLVSDVGSLREHGVERMFWLEEPEDHFPKTEQEGNDRMIGLEKDVNAPTRAVVYICRPTLSLIRVISGHILYDRRTAANANSLKHTYHALFSPRRTELALQLLSSIATPSILSDLNLHDLGLEFVPLEQDVLSLEEEKAWSDIWAKGDHGVIHRSAMALMTVQHVYGAFPRIVGKGDMAKRLSSLLLRQRREYLASDPSNPSLQNPSRSIDSLIIIDRSVDLATPLCTQLTYEGLVDEVIGIRSAHVEVDPALVSDARTNLAPAASTASGSTTPIPSARKTKKVRLDRTIDPLFGSIRDENFAIVGEKLHTSAKRLNEDYERRHNAKTVSEMRAFVSKLGGLTKAHASLRLHTGLTERIMEFTTQEIFNASLELQQNIVAGVDLNDQLSNIEDLLSAQAPVLTVIRLLCLFSVVSGGIKPKNLEYLKREIVQTYGYEYIPLLDMLAKTGLMTRATPSSTRTSVGFQAVRSSLRLVVDDIDEHDPNDVSYTYSGYAPLSIRLVQAIAQKDALLARNTGQSQGGQSLSLASAPKAHPILGWRGFEDVVRSLEGATFDEVQGKDEIHTRAGIDGANARKTTDTSNIAANPPGMGSSALNATTTTMVFFLGGVTFAEISALRFMASRTRNRRFLIATTNTITGDTMIKSLQ
ncbi:Sec1-like protein [Meira miltonrushii]|uniref:Sec1-like protein n=1 Tax=Meira miltonrushii TaxID=1280837 RepID=A0A316VDH3_9BASI|nr:Sec1-like protein [Meira miltonrushii]PWN34313.1 Sec1-like protein [Meira miltonrushii]